MCRGVEVRALRAIRHTYTPLHAYTTQTRCARRALLTLHVYTSHAYTHEVPALIPPRHIDDRQHTFASDVATDVLLDDF
jgi:hypothetical protein